MKYTITIFVSLMSSLMLSSMASAATYYQCPRQIDAEVTSNLPDGWWATPQRGKLTRTDIAKIGGDVTLLCLYRAFGTEVTVMRKAPAGMGCEATPAGFKCAEGVRQGSSSGSGKTIDVSGRTSAPVNTKIQGSTVDVLRGISAPVNIKVQGGTQVTPGNTKGGKTPTVKYGGSCPDPMINGVEVRMLSRDPSGQYFFRLAATVENAGRGDYSTGSNQQIVELHQIPTGGSARRLNSWDFGSIPAGDDGLVATYDVLRWRISDEFPPSYRFSIIYDADIRQDGNTANDDCSTRNNTATITGEDINAIIRGSGI